MGYFTDLLYNLDYMLDFKYVLSFMLVFVAVYGLIDVSGIFTRKSKDGKEYRLWKIEMILSIAISFLVLYNPGTATWIFNVVTEFTNWMLVIFFGAVLLYMFTKLTVFRGGAYEEDTIKKIVGVVKWGGFILGAILFFYFMSKYAPIGNLSMASNVIGPLIVIGLFVGIPIWYIRHTSRNRQPTSEERKEEREMRSLALKNCIEREMEALEKQGIPKDKAMSMAQEHCTELIKKGLI